MFTHFWYAAAVCSHYAISLCFLLYFSKPLVCLFPALFTQNLLSFINLLHPALPQTSVLHLLKCLSQDPHPNPWISALCRQLKRRISAENDEPLYTPQCSQRLKELSQHLCVSGQSGGWSSCFSKKAESVSEYSFGSSGATQRKRKISVVILDTDDEDAGLQSKRIRTDVCGRDGVKADKQTTSEETSVELEERAATEPSTVELQPELDTSDSLPEHVKVFADFYCRFYYKKVHRIWFYPTIYS